MKTTGYKKNELLDIAREAKLQSIPTKTDHYVDEVSCQTLRRTVEGKVYPHPMRSNFSWKDDLSCLPNIESYDVQFYLKCKCMWTNDRLKSYKNDNSYRLHTNGHISQVEMVALDDKFRYVRAKCTPEERQSAPPYDIWILIDVDGVINSGECTCVAYVSILNKIDCKRFYRL